MATFQNNRAEIEQKVMVRLLSEIECNPSFTQRRLANELGIALGLMNQYLRSCITKGWLRATHVSPKRITYFLTPEGFLEKSNMVTGYLTRSLTFFKEARVQCETLFEVCLVKKYTRIALVGSGDLADIAKLVAHGKNLNLIIADESNDVSSFDAVIITTIENPQGTYDILKTKIDNRRLLTLPLLHISRTKP